MKNKIVLMIKGFLFGIANIIPGVSGGTLALTMGVYEDLIESISHFFKDVKKSLKFLCVFGLGAVLSILLMSKVISLSLDKFPFPTTLFFVGLIIGGIPLLTRKARKNKVKPFNVLLFLITFGIVIGMAFMQEGNNVVSLSNVTPWMMFLLFIVGMVAAATMVIPGISGSLLLMLLGFYEPILNTIKNIISFNNFWHNAFVLIPFGIGCLLGIVVISIILKYLLKHYEINTYYGIIGFVVSSIVGIFYNQLDVIKEVFAANSFGINLLQVLIGIILFTLGAILTYRLSKLEN